MVETKRLNSFPNFILLNVHRVVGVPKVYGLKELHATRIPEKLSTLPKACDVTWPEKCKQTWTDSSISLVPFVLNIYIYIYKMKYIKTFFGTRNFSCTCKNCEVLLY